MEDECFFVSHVVAHDHSMVLVTCKPQRISLPMQGKKMFI